MKKIPSWNFEKHKDCFGNKGITSKDHIYPKALGGINSRRNWQILSKKSKQRKGSKITGKINKIGFRVIKYKDLNNKIYGKMRIFFNNEWVEVEKNY